MSLGTIDTEHDFQRTAYVNGRCLNIAASLWHAPRPGEWSLGSVSNGPAESGMLALVAAWLRHRSAALAANRPDLRPNFIVPRLHRKEWDRFAALWSIELREAPLDAASLTVDPEGVAALADESTIAVVLNAAAPVTGLVDDIEAVSCALDKVQQGGGPDVPVHVDATTAGFVLPWANPTLPWDFRVKRVRSVSADPARHFRHISTNGWVVWRDASCLPEGMISHVGYLGLDIPQVGMNFAHPVRDTFSHYAAYVKMGPEAFGRKCLGRINELDDLARHVELRTGLRRLSPRILSTTLAWRVPDGLDIDAALVTMRNDGLKATLHRLPQPVVTLES